MKRFIIILFFLIALLLGAIFGIALPHMEKEIQNNLAELGYPQTSIERVNVNLAGLSIPRINLDPDGFNQIKNTTVNLFWPTYLINKKIDKINIQSMNLYVLDKDLQRIIRQLNKQRNINSLPAENIAIEEITLNLTAHNTSLKFNGDLRVNQKNNKYYLNGNLSSNQYELSFISKWEGIINSQDKTMEVDGNFNDIKINTNNLAINRGTGWFSYHSSDLENIVGAQFDAGSGQIFRIPANDIMLTLGQNMDNYPVLFRAKASGIEDVYFNADYNYHSKVENRFFQSVLNIPGLDTFLEHLAELELLKDRYKTNTNTALNLVLEYEKEKKFPSGPLPFRLTSNDKVDGTILLYPDSYDVRGTITTNETILPAIKNIFDINEGHVNDNVIRIDTNVRSYIQ